ncbi:NAD(P)-dependent oxidoreductase [uncultured Oscillibacter sp.]|uniref:NAD-dependent epimerase/dehydratase family protein n=1 Tax=uncultured Oscillibacter sp. TaxID=876091 RepID=UPI0025E05E9C|nr:NAD(P)-dependent oxidoreductase [uncultured Oscillibacter sp.]
MSNMQKKAIVTGANGFVGSYVAHSLVKEGYQVWAVVRNRQSNIENLMSDHVQIVFCDLAGISELPSIITERGFDCFYHLAWEGSSGVHRANYEMQMNNATASGHAVAAACRLQCNRFVGTGSVTQLMYRDYLHQDGCMPDMVTCYAIGKIAAENICRCVAADQKIEFVWCYLSNFYGVGDKTQNIINFLIKSYMRGMVPSLTAGMQLADFMYVSDVAAALLCLGSKGQSGFTYYVGQGNPRPLCEFVREIRDLVSPAMETGLGQIPFRGLSIDFNTCNLSKLYKDTGFCPTVSFSSGIERTYAWIKKAEEGGAWIV